MPIGNQLWCICVNHPSDSPLVHSWTVISSLSESSTFTSLLFAWHSNKVSWYCPELAAFMLDAPLMKLFKCHVFILVSELLNSYLSNKLPRHNQTLPGSGPGLATPLSYTSLKPENSVYCLFVLLLCTKNFRLLLLTRRQLSTCKNGFSKKQPNKVWMTPQYFRGVEISLAGLISAWLIHTNAYHIGYLCVIRFGLLCSCNSRHWQILLRAMTS